ncbi:hypothetical protein ACFJGW_09900 [Burkholderiaceae bacterium UC74_6]
MRTATLPGDPQLDRLDAPAVHASREETGAADKPASAAIRDRLSVQLRGDLVSRLRESALQQRTTTTALLRRAAQALLDGKSDPLGLDKPSRKRAQARPGPRAKVLLCMSAEHAALLIGRARAAEMTYGSYVGALLDGKVPLPVPTHHAASVLDLRASTDRLAAMSTDLNAFAQLLGKVPATQLEPLRASLSSLIVDVRKHLSLSAVLIAELQPYRRGRR